MRVPLLGAPKVCGEVRSRDRCVRIFGEEVVIWRVGLSITVRLQLVRNVPQCDEPTKADNSRSESVKPFLKPHSIELIRYDLVFSFHNLQAPC